MMFGEIITGDCENRTKITYIFRINWFASVVLIVTTLPLQIKL